VIPPPVARGAHPVALVLEDLAHHFAHIVVVFDEEDLMHPPMIRR